MVDCRLWCRNDRSVIELATNADKMLLGDRELDEFENTFLESKSTDNRHIEEKHLSIARWKYRENVKWPYTIAYFELYGGRNLDHPG